MNGKEAPDKRWDSDLPTSVQHSLQAANIHELHQLLEADPRKLACTRTIGRKTMAALRDVVLQQTEMIRERWLGWESPDSRRIAKDLDHPTNDEDILRVRLAHIEGRIEAMRDQARRMEPVVKKILKQIREITK